MMNEYYDQWVWDWMWKELWFLVLNGDYLGNCSSVMVLWILHITCLVKVRGMIDLLQFIESQSSVILQK